MFFINSVCKTFYSIKQKMLAIKKIKLYEVITSV